MTEFMQPPTIILRVPCDKMSGTVLVRDQEALRFIHILALKHIQADGSVTRLLDAFGLGRQVMQEVLADLIFDEAVRIDLEKDRALVAEPYASLLASDRMEELKLRIYRTTEVRVTWLLDRISGAVFVDRDLGRYTRIPAGPTITKEVKSPAQETPDIKQTANALLARAAVPVIEERLGAREFDISRVEQIEDKRRLRSDTLHIPLKVVSAGQGGAEYFIPDAPGVPPQVREMWGSLLNRGVVVPGLEPGNASEGLVPAPDQVAQQVEARCQAIQEGISQDVGSAAVVARLERELASLKSLLRTADEIERSSGQHGSIVGNRDTQLEGLERMLAVAERTIVICSAFASENGLEAVLRLVASKAKAGVRIAFVQGLMGSLDPTDTHEFGDARGLFHRALSSLPAEARSNVILARTRRPTHSKFIIIDGILVAVSSCNWLSGSGGGPIEVTAVTRAQLPATDVLEHAIDVLPNEILQLMQVPDALRRAKGREVRTLFFKRLYEAVEDGWTNFLGEPSPASRDAVLVALEKVRKSAEALRTLRPAHVILDSEHRPLMFRITESATESVLVSSDRFSEDAAGGRFAELVEAATSRNVRVTLVWGRSATLHDADAQASAGAAKKFLGRYESKPPLLELTTAPSANHSKVILADRKSVLVSSFNFLSFGADEARQSSRELGLFIQDPEQAAAIGDGLAGLLNMVANLERPKGIAPANAGPGSLLPPRASRSRPSFVVPP